MRFSAVVSISAVVVVAAVAAAAVAAAALGESPPGTHGRAVRLCNSSSSNSIYSNSSSYTAVVLPIRAFLWACLLVVSSFLSMFKGPRQQQNFMLRHNRRLLLLSDFLKSQSLSTFSWGSSPPGSFFF